MSIKFLPHPLMDGFAYCMFCESICTRHIVPLFDGFICLKCGKEMMDELNGDNNIYIDNRQMRLNLNRFGRAQDQAIMFDL